MLNALFQELPNAFVQGIISTETSYYFSIGDSKKTVILTSEGCRVDDGKTLENVTCVCKTDPDFFLRIWNDGYRPGMSDFLGGKIKSNNPMALQDFLAAFGK